MWLLTKLKLAAEVINRLDAHHKLYISSGFAVFAFLIMLKEQDLPLRLMSTWICYLVPSILLSWTTILSANPAQVKIEAKAQDSTQKMIFFFIVIAAFASLFAILILLNTIATPAKTTQSIPILVPLACVLGSWWLVHTIFTLRYADLFYIDMNDKLDTNKGKGLIFPHTTEPDYLDFTYFSFVIGMTFQVSDVQITSKRIRRLALIHGLLAFAFNTFIVAFMINIIAGIIQR